MSIRKEDLSESRDDFLAESIACAEKMCREAFEEIGRASKIGDKAVQGIVSGVKTIASKVSDIVPDGVEEVACEFGKGGKDFFTGVAYSGEMTVDGLTQLFNAISPVDLPEVDLVELPESKWATAGVVAGTAAQIAAITYGVGAGFGAAGMKTGFASTLGRSTTTGLAVGLIKPVPAGENYWDSKVTDVAIGIGAGVVAASVGHALTKVPLLAGEPGHPNLIQSVAARAIPGIPKGAAQANLRAVLQSGRLATVEETTEGILRSSTTGAVSGGLTHVVGSVHDSFEH